MFVPETGSGAKRSVPAADSKPSLLSGNKTSCSSIVSGLFWNSGAYNKQRTSYRKVEFPEELFFDTRDAIKKSVYQGRRDSGNPGSRWKKCFFHSRGEFGRGKPGKEVARRQDLHPREFGK